MANRSSNDDVQRVRDATDLVSLIGEHVALRQRGREFVGLCPFHDDSNPSFSVVVHKGNPFYKCHACGAAGDCFNFVMDYHKMEFGVALRHLAERAGIELQQRSSASNDPASSPRAALLEANAIAERYFQQTLQSQSAAAARAELARRGYSTVVVDAFHIGAAPQGWDGLLNFVSHRNEDPRAFANAGLLRQRNQGSGFYDSFRNRLIFPIHDELGRPIAFGGRRLDPDEEPKYLNSSESAVFDKSSTLYALAQAKRAIIDSGSAIVTEGYTDVITCHQHGFTNVVATLGTALTPNHARVLSRLCDTVVLLFDGDAAGQKAADRAIEVFFSSRLDVRICVLPEGLDPDELLRQPDGAERFRQCIADAEDALTYKIARVRDELRDISSLSARQNRIDRVINDLARIGFGSIQGVRKAMVVQQIAEILHVSADDITQALAKATHRSTASRPSASSEGYPSADTPLGARERAERELIGMIVSEPELLEEQIDLEGTNGGVVADFITSLNFADDTCRAIIDRVLALRDAGDVSTSTILQELDQKQRAVATSFVGRDAEQEGATVVGDDGVSRTCVILHMMAQREAFEMEVAGLRGSNEALSGEKISALIAQRRQQDFVGNRMPRVRLNRVE